MPYTFLTPVNMAGLEVRDVRAETVGALPTADGTQAGRYVYHSGQLKYCNGSSWIILGAEGAGGPPSGTATGDLSGSYPGPQVVDDSHAHTGATISALDTADVTTGTFVAARLPALNGITAPTAPVSMNNQLLTNLPAPSAGGDATNKTYVDNAIAGLDAKASCFCGTTANITLSNHGVMDGVTPTNGQRVLVKNQSSPQENGIYVSDGTALTRATDMDSWAEVPNAYTWVEAGTTQADTGWVCTSAQGGTLGSTAISWVQFNAGGSFIAGGGLTLTGNTFDVGAGTGIIVAADAINVDVVALPVPRSYSINVAAGTAVVINHALNTRDVHVEVYRSTTPWDTILCDVERTDVNNVTLRFAVAVASNAYRCVVQGR